MEKLSQEEMLAAQGGSFWTGVGCGAGIAGIMLTEGGILAVDPAVGVATVAACADALGF